MDMSTPVGSLAAGQMAAENTQAPEAFAAFLPVAKASLLSGQRRGRPPSLSSDGVFASHQGDFATERGQVRPRDSSMIIDLTGQHVRNLDDRSLIAVILAPAYVRESHSPWPRST